MKSSTPHLMIKADATGNYNLSSVQRHKRQTHHYACMVYKIAQNGALISSGSLICIY